jgi:hypothetical protein
MKGRLGAWQLYAGINQAVYVNNYTEAAVVSVSVLLIQQVKLAQVQQSGSNTKLKLWAKVF